MNVFLLRLILIIINVLGNRIDIRIDNRFILYKDLFFLTIIIVALALLLKE